MPGLYKYIRQQALTDKIRECIDKKRKGDFKLKIDLTESCENACDLNRPTIISFYN